MEKKGLSPSTFTCLAGEDDEELAVAPFQVHYCSTSFADSFADFFFYTNLSGLILRQTTPSTCKYSLLDIRDYTCSSMYFFFFLVCF